MSSYKVPSGLSSLRDSSKFSDLQIHCCGRIFKVHKAIVCPQSAFFMMACDGPFKEAATNTVELRGEDPATVEKMIQYFYEFNYEDRCDITETLNEENITASVLTHVAVYALAEKCLATELKDCAAGKFATWVKDVDCWVGAVPQVLKEVYSSTPQSDRKLRDMIVTAICGKAGVSFDGAEMGDVLSDFPEACLDILKAAVSLGKPAPGLNVLFDKLSETISSFKETRRSIRKGQRSSRSRKG